MILRAYMDETEEQDVEVKEVEEPIEEPPAPVQAPALVETPAPAPQLASALVSNEVGETKISFSDADTFVNTSGEKTIVSAPKDDKSLEESAKERSLIADEEDDEDPEDERLSIGENIELDITDINDLNKSATSAALALKAPVLDFEVLY
jgi:hypothetical protein